MRTTYRGYTIEILFNTYRQAWGGHWWPSAFDDASAVERTNESQMAYAEHATEAEALAYIVAHIDAFSPMTAKQAAA